MAKLESIDPDDSGRPSHGEQQQLPEKQPTWQSPQGMAQPSPKPGVVQLPFQAVLAGTQTTQSQDQMDGSGISGGNSVSMDYSGSQVVRNLDVGVPWSTGMFDCQKDPHNAFVTALFPCITFGQIVEVLDSGDMECPLAGYIYLAMMPALCSHWLIGSKYRRKLRTRYNLVKAPYSDVVSHIFCPCCALAQEFRELHTRGLDPSLGWNGILDQAQRTRDPPPKQSMTRS